MHEEPGDQYPYNGVFMIYEDVFWEASQGSQEA